MRSHPYQWRALLLMMLAWSVIGLVHNGISFLFPYFSETFALSTAHNGYLTGTLAFFWTLSILVNGPLADRIGQVRLMVPGLVLGAVAFGLSAAVGSVALLYVLTALAGFGCGAIVPASLSFLAEQSAPEKRGAVELHADRFGDRCGGVHAACCDGGWLARELSCDRRTLGAGRAAALCLWAWDPAQQRDDER